MLDNITFYMDYCYDLLNEFVSGRIHTLPYLI